MTNRFSPDLRAGATGVTDAVLIRDAETNREVTGLAAADVRVAYWRQGGLATEVAAVDLAAADDPHQAGGWLEVDPVLQAGIYRVDLPDEAAAEGADWVVLSVTARDGDSFVYHRTYRLIDSIPADALTVEGEPAMDQLREAASICVGTGASRVWIALLDGDEGVADADVWITADAEGLRLVAGTRRTDTAGRVDFLLDLGVDYWLWAQKDGWQPVLGRRFTAEEDLEVRMASRAPAAAPRDAGLSPCRIQIQSEGAPVVGAEASVTADRAGRRHAAGPGTTDHAGVVWLLLRPGGTYYLWATAPGMAPVRGLQFIAGED